MHLLFFWWVAVENFSAALADPPHKEDRKMVNGKIPVINRWCGERDDSFVVIAGSEFEPNDTILKIPF